MVTKSNEINRLSDLFDLGKSRSLCQAFDNKTLTKEEIPILGHHILVQKNSRKDF